MAPPLPGFPQRFGRYVLDAPLGTGGMAEVFRGRLMDGGAGQKLGFERAVCIKRILPHLRSAPGFRAMFQDEARIASRLQHQNVVSVIDYGEVEGAPFIVMELVDGVSVAEIAADLMARGERLSPPQVLALGEMICHGLAHAHTALDRDGAPLGVVHRDVTPHNILVGSDGIAKLADFGIARAEGRLARTETGVLKGKLPYQSPEQARSEPYDHRVDQFATGIVLWELLVGASLFADTSEYKILEAVLKKEAPPPSTIAQTPRPLDAVILRALHKDPARRYPDMEAFGRALADAAFALRAPPSSSDLRPVVERAKARKALALAREVAAPTASFRSRSSSGPLLEVPRVAVPVMSVERARSRGPLVAAAVLVASVIIGWVWARTESAQVTPDRRRADAGTMVARISAADAGLASPRVEVDAGGAPPDAAQMGTGQITAAVITPMVALAVATNRSAYGVCAEPPRTFVPTAASAAPMASTVAVGFEGAQGGADVVVTVRRAEARTLVVSSGSRSDLKIVVAAGVQLRRIIVLGAHRLRPVVEGAPDVVVENRSGGTGAVVIGRPPDAVRGDRHDPLFAELRALLASDSAIVWCDWAKEIVVDDGSLATAPAEPLVAEADRVRVDDDRARARAAPDACARRCEEAQRSTLPAFATATDLRRFDAVLTPCLACISSATP